MARYVDIECNAVTEVLPRRAFKTRQDIQDFLDGIPTADVAPVIHGKWEVIHIKTIGIKRGARRISGFLKAMNGVQITALYAAQRWTEVQNNAESV